MFGQPCVIADCGVVPEGTDVNLTEDDGTGDAYADWPEDSDIDFTKVCSGGGKPLRIGILFLLLVYCARNVRLNFLHTTTVDASLDEIL